jgi:hypothetical protein
MCLHLFTGAAFLENGYALIFQSRSVEMLPHFEKKKPSAVTHLVQASTGAQQAAFTDAFRKIPSRSDLHSSLFSALTAFSAIAQGEGVPDTLLLELGKMPSDLA